MKLNVCIDKSVKSPDIRHKNKNRNKNKNKNKKRVSVKKLSYLAILNVHRQK